LEAGLDCFQVVLSCYSVCLAGKTLFLHKIFGKRMKKYTSFGELLKDYREFYGLAQEDIAALLDVDRRTVARWEQNVSWLKQDREKLFAEKSSIPLQVIRNLNAETPIPAWYDLKKRVYSLSKASYKLQKASWYHPVESLDTERFHSISGEEDFQFITDIQRLNKNPRPLKPELIKEAANLLPELNVILHDHAGLYAGHMAVLPLKYATYFKIRRGEIPESSLQPVDFDGYRQSSPMVYYYYSIYADSPDNTYYIASRLLNYFKQKRDKDYLFAGISYGLREMKVNLFKEMGLRTVWEKPVAEGASEKMLLLEGNFDMFLFNKRG
jgi:transcriptional regulator with XRE-family HTH domain